LLVDFRGKFIGGTAETADRGTGAEVATLRAGVFVDGFGLPPEGWFEGEGGSSKRHLAAGGKAAEKSGEQVGGVSVTADGTDERGVTVAEFTGDRGVVVGGEAGRGTVDVADNAELLRFGDRVLTASSAVAKKVE